MAAQLIFGLDLGLNNVGWAAIRINEDAEEDQLDILNMGTYVFESPLEEPNKPTSGLKTRDRGIKRRSRRTIRRRRERRHRLYRLLAEHGLLPSDPKERVELLCRHTRNGEPVHPYALRAAALERPLAPFELGRVFCHINQRRAFLSPRKLMLLSAGDFDLPEEIDEKDEESGLILGEIKQTKEAMAGHETLGAFLDQRIRAGEPVRKKKLKPAEKNARITAQELKAHEARRFVRADRAMMEAEFHRIAAAQAPHHPLLTKGLLDQIRSIIFSQRPMGADQGTRGSCTFFPDQKRSPRASLPAQKFALAQLVAGLRWLGPGSSEEQRLGSAAPALVDLLLKKEIVTWDEAKDACRLPIGSRFTIEPGRTKGKGRAKTTELGVKKHLTGSKTCEAMRRVIGAKWDLLSWEEQADLTGLIVSTRDWVRKARPGQKSASIAKPAAVRRFELLSTRVFGKAQVQFTREEAAQLATLKLPEGYLSISHKAIRKIMPSMLGAVCGGVPQYLDYSEACARARIDHSVPHQVPRLLEQLPSPQEDAIRHPLVLCSVRNAVKVLNALRKEYGQPDRIHIELPRDLARSAEQREEVEKMQKENEKERLAIAKDLQDAGIAPIPQNIKKYRLWMECREGLPYEPDHVISCVKELCDPGRYDIDHIVPRSHNLDSGMGNITLCTADFNRLRKSNKTPFETFRDNPDEWAKIKAHVMGLKSMPLGKRRRILAVERPEEFTGRHLAATGYISKAVYDLARQMVADDTQITVTQGRATSELRGLWGLDTLVERHPEEQAEWNVYEAALDEYIDGKRPPSEVPPTPALKGRSNFKHHALDALVIALTSKSALQRVAQMRQLEDSGQLKLLEKAEKKKQRLEAAPDVAIRSKAKGALERAAIVHKPYRKVGGEFNKAGADPDALKDLGPGEPGKAKVVGRHLVRYNEDGAPFIAQPLGANHHMVVWESLAANKKGVVERRVEVVTLVEAYRRARDKEPVIQRESSRPGWRFVMSLCKGDMVEMEDGTLGVVSKFSPINQDTAEVVIWQCYAARQLGLRNDSNPYLVRRIVSNPWLFKIIRRVILDPLGRIRYSEGEPR